MTIVVSDTSPVRALAHLGRLELLRELFTEVIVPPAVECELRRPPAGQIAVDLDGLPFVRVQQASDRSSVERFLVALDLGESEALALAPEVRADLIRIDEAAGRARAKQVGLTPIGVLGVLLAAKQRGELEHLSPLMDRLQTELHFFISSPLRAGVLRLADESA